MVGKRPDPPPRAAISNRVQQLVEQAKAHHFKATPKAKPVATPARSGTPPPAAKKSSPGSNMSVDSPATSPPINPPDYKRMRSADSTTSDGASSVPSLPSFSASSYKQKGVHRADSASTIAVDLARMTLSGPESLIS